MNINNEYFIRNVAGGTNALGAIVKINDDAQSI
jgi:hypothetical protein